MQGKDANTYELAARSLLCLGARNDCEPKGGRRGEGSVSGISQFPFCFRGVCALPHTPRAPLLLSPFVLLDLFPWNPVVLLSLSLFFLLFSFSFSSLLEVVLGMEKDGRLEEGHTHTQREISIPHPSFLLVLLLLLFFFHLHFCANEKCKAKAKLGQRNTESEKGRRKKRRMNIRFAKQTASPLPFLDFFSLTRSPGNRAEQPQSAVGANEVGLLSSRPHGVAGTTSAGACMRVCACVEPHSTPRCLPTLLSFSLSLSVLLIFSLFVLFGLSRKETCAPPLPLSLPLFLSSSPFSFFPHTHARKCLNNHFKETFFFSFFLFFQVFFPER